MIPLISAATRLLFSEARIKTLHPQQAVSDFFSFTDAVSRKNALEEGFLVDVSALSNKIFQTAPVAITREIWELCVSVNRAESRFKQQAILISILCQAKVAIKRAPAHATDTSFNMKWFPRSIKAHLEKLCLWIAVSTDEHNKPVLTLMLDSQHTVNGFMSSSICQQHLKLKTIE
jgi:hypothetical protein